MPDEPTRRNVLTPRLIGSGVVVVLVLAFAFANSKRVQVDFLVTDRKSRLIYVILGSAVLGALASWLFRRRHDHD